MNRYWRVKLPPGERSRFGSYARRLWDGLLTREELRDL